MQYRDQLTYREQVLFYFYFEWSDMSIGKIIAKSKKFDLTPKGQLEHAKKWHNKIDDLIAAYEKSNKDPRLAAKKIADFMKMILGKELVYGLESVGNK